MRGSKLKNEESIERAGEDVEQEEMPYIAGRKSEWYNHFASNLAVAYKVEHAISSGHSNRIV